MEKEGLVRGIKRISDDLKFGCLITDRHIQVAKWVCENMENTSHKYHIWHFAKGKTLQILHKLSF